jgi:predicted  nucleic acid-binding Zn-ribbon protein
LRQAQHERSHLQSQIADIPSQLEQFNKERSQAIAVELSPLREQLSNVQTQFSSINSSLPILSVNQPSQPYTIVDILLHLRFECF